MFEVEEIVIINRDPSEVFDVAADPERQLEWDAGTLKDVEKLTAEPLGAGARYRGTFKGFGTVEYEYDVFEPPQRFSHTAELPIGGVHHAFELARAEWDPTDAEDRRDAEGSGQAHRTRDEGDDPEADAHHQLGAEEPPRALNAA
jgi:uncharacterized protein YndB with AHSA1/START domain